VLHYSFTPLLHYFVFVRHITRQEQVDSICSAKLYALILAIFPNLQSHSLAESSWNKWRFP
jgi:hypothetical protein